MKDRIPPPEGFIPNPGQAPDLLFIRGTLNGQPHTHRTVAYRPLAPWRGSSDSFHGPCSHYGDPLPSEAKS